jgi:hypothetical protein
MLYNIQVVLDLVRDIYLPLFSKRKRITIVYSVGTGVPSFICFQMATWAGAGVENKNRLLLYVLHCITEV